MFGQSCVLCNKPQLFTAKTREVCQLLKLDRDTLNDILKENPIAASNIMDNEILVCLQRSALTFFFLKKSNKLVVLYAFFPSHRNDFFTQAQIF